MRLLGLSRDLNDVTLSLHIFGHSTGSLLRNASILKLLYLFLLFSFYNSHTNSYSYLHFLLIKTNIFGFFTNWNYEELHTFWTTKSLCIKNKVHLARLVGLGVWFSLEVREISGSNPGRALRSAYSPSCLFGQFAMEGNADSFDRQIFPSQS